MGKGPKIVKIDLKATNTNVCFIVSQIQNLNTKFYTKEHLQFCIFSKSSLMMGIHVSKIGKILDFEAIMF